MATDTKSHETIDMPVPTNPESEYAWLVKTLQQYIDKNMKEANKYSKLDRLVSIPSIIITCVSGIAAVIATHDVSDQAQNMIGISVGIMASISTMLQSMSKGYNFSAKADKFRKLSEEFTTYQNTLVGEMRSANETQTNTGKPIEYSNYIKKLKKHIEILGSINTFSDTGNRDETPQKKYISEQLAVANMLSVTR